MSKTAQPSFPESAVAFLGKLAKNNDKEWFEKNRAVFESDLLMPAQEFVETLGAELRKIRPGIVAIPKIDKSIFRLHRDVRFSKDKSPYKTNLGLLFWEGSGNKMENPGMYVHLEPGMFASAIGMHMFSKEQLAVYRDAVADPVTRKKLLDVIKAIEKKGYEIRGKSFKKVPKGYDADMPNAELLLHDGVFVWYETKDTAAADAKNIKKLCVKLFKDMLPLHEWLLATMGTGKAK